MITSGFTLGTSVFTHFTSARPRYAPDDVAVKNKNKISRETKMGEKKKLILSCNITTICMVGSNHFYEPRNKAFIHAHRSVFLLSWLFFASKQKFFEKRKCS